MIRSENDRNKGNRITMYRYDAGDDGERLVGHQGSLSKSTFSEGATTRGVAPSLVKNISPTCWRCLTISTGEAFNNRRPD
jgi:hypothetical protein